MPNSLPNPELHLNSYSRFTTIYSSLSGNLKVIRK